MTRTTLVILSVLMALGCGKKEEPPEPAASPPSATGETHPTTPAAPAEPEGPVFRSTVMGMERVEALGTIDLSTAGLAGFTIQAPESATAESSILSGVQVSAPPLNYSVVIREGAFSLEGAKAGREVMDPEGTALEEDERHLLWQGSGTRGFSFSMQVDVDGQPYTCGTVATAFAFTRDQVDQMIESCRSLSKAAG
jgi:hypothetical protein